MALLLMLTLTVACCILANKYLEYSKNREYRKAFIFKTFASLCFVIVGAVAMTGCWDTEFAHLVFAGLVCGFFGDVLLALRFTHPGKKTVFFASGTLVFFAGHILYIIALLSFTYESLKIAVPYTVAGMILSLIYAKKNKVNAGKMTVPGTVYMATVIFMGGCAAGTAVYGLSPGTVLFAIGGLFFALSDNILTANCFGKKHTESRNRALHILYYSAQIFIAFSMILLFIF